MSGRFLLRALQAAHRLSLAPARRRFEIAAQDCERAQASRLRAIIGANADTAYGRGFGFAAISSLRQWRDRVPLVGYDELAPWVERAAQGEARVLTAAPVRVFERTSGSTSANKLVPYTDALLAEFAAATGPWLFDLYSTLPALRGTRSYWAISPATRSSERTAGGTPIGFEDDTEYFGGFARRAVRRTLAVPPEVARLRDMETWSVTTARHLVAAEDLGLVSVWHPSFFTLLLRAIDTRLAELLDDVAPRRAAAVRERLATRPLGEALWPRLTLVSCWADAAAADALPALRRLVPHARLQPKGLLATEGVVSFPLWHGDRSYAVAAIASHFLEFIDLEHPSACPRLAHELRVGGTYTPVLTTGGGFYRYRLGDAVRCEGFHGQAPVLRFQGRVDQVSDLCGEKLDARLVGEALRRARRETSAEPSFALVVPLPGERPRYRLYVEGVAAAARAALAASLDRALADADGYRYARNLGQLAPLEAVAVRDGAARYRDARVAARQRAGDVKPTHLDGGIDWTAVFGGVEGDVA